MPSQQAVLRMGYSGDVVMSDTEDPLNQLNNVYLQEIVDGYNLTYSFGCTYLDEEGIVNDCSIDQGIQDESMNRPYTFWIEQVTSITRVTHSCTVNRLFFMLDSQHMLNILSLHNNDLNLDEINTYSLDSLFSYRQVDKLGCNVHEFA